MYLPAPSASRSSLMKASRLVLSSGHLPPPSATFRNCVQVISTVDSRGGEQPNSQSMSTPSRLWEERKDLTLPMNLARLAFEETIFEK